jgi:hypothetical protein
MYHQQSFQKMTYFTAKVLPMKTLPPVGRNLYRALGTDNATNGTDATANAVHSKERDLQRIQQQQQRIQKPNRFTSTYNEMQLTCPDPIENYAKCVVAAQQQVKDGDGMSSGSTHNACATEFRAVKECFRAIRRRQQQHSSKTII